MSHISTSHKEAQKGNVHSLRQTLHRKTTEEALLDAWNGKAPQNPHNDPELLKAEALIANDMFNHYIRPNLRRAIGAPHYVTGPEKNIGRAMIKKNGKAGDNCDWARHSNLLNNLGMAALTSDMLSNRGVLTLRTTENLLIDLFIVDADNTFIKEDPKKLGLRMINTKFLIPIVIKDGVETYHILELRSYLASSEDAYQKSEAEYQKYRSAFSLKSSYDRALTLISPTDGAAQKRLRLAWSQAETNAENALLRRTKLNMQDAERNGANALLGYVPRPPSSNASWSLMTYDEYMLKVYTEKDFPLSYAPRQA